MCHTRHSKAASSPSALTAVIAAGLFSILGWSGDLTAQGPTTEQKLLPGDVAQGHLRDNSVAVRGRIAVVGAVAADVGAADSGAAYVFEPAGNAWGQTARLAASDGASNDYFGSSVAIDDGGTIVVGAEGKDAGRGAAYVFEKNSGGVWVQTARLTASDGAVGDQFGFAAAIDGDTLLIGAPWRGGVSGATYVFERSLGIWQQTAILVASDVAPMDYFGHTVSVEGDLALIGSPADDDRGNNCGSAYVFTRSNGAWAQSAKLLADDAAADDFLARTGSISNGTIVLGARDNDDNGSSSGSAYVFDQQNGVWTQTAKLLASDGQAGDVFGHAVAISGDRIVVGAKFRSDNGSTSGAAYLFARSAGGWTETARLNASDARSGAAFGQSVAVAGRLILVGARDSVLARGVAYLYQEPSSVDPNLSTVTADDLTISAYGGTTRVQVTPKKSDGANVGAGLAVVVHTTGGLLIGAVTDNGDGTYTQVVQGTPGLDEIVLSATADEVVLVATATITLVTVNADLSTVTVDPSEVTAGQSANVTVTPRSQTGAVLGAGLQVSIFSTLGSLAGSVRDHGDGTYTQQLDTAAAGTADITAIVDGVALTAGATLIVQPSVIGNVVGFRADNTTMVYRTIQHAVSASTLHQLVKIVVAPGRYDEVVRIYRRHDLRLETMPTMGLTTIRGLHIWCSSGIAVDGFEIDATGTRCGGVTMHASRAITMRNTMVHDADGTGIAVGFWCSDVLLDSCVVENNGGDGIAIGYRTGGVRILRSTVRGNRSSGIHIGWRAELRIAGCTIVDNGRRTQRCRHHGGYGVYMQRECRRRAAPELVTLIQNTVTGNHGRVIRGRADANFGNYDQFIDRTDDQAPFNR